MRVMAIAGSLREGSFNRALVRAAAGLAPEGMDVRVWDALGQVPHYDGSLDADGRRPAAVDALKREIADADGLLFATPEYNYSVPGVLKNAIDWASRPAGTSVLARKPVAVAGASTGAVGTARAQAHLREILYSCQARVMPHPGVLVNFAPQKFAEGRLSDASTREFLAAFLAQLRDFVQHCRGG